MRLKAYPVYLLYKTCFSLLFSMATVLSLVYYSEVVGLNALQLVLVGTVLLTGLMRSLREPVLTAWIRSSGALSWGALPSRALSPGGSPARPCCCPPCSWCPRRGERGGKKPEAPGGLCILDGPRR